MSGQCSASPVWNHPIDVADPQTRPLPRPPPRFCGWPPGPGRPLPPGHPFAALRGGLVPRACGPCLLPPRSWALRDSNLDRRPGPGVPA